MADFIRDRMARIFAVSREEELNRILHSLSPFEKTILGALVLILILSTFSVLIQINNSFTTTMPASGGSIAEGVIGSPRFINPLLAISDADRDLIALIYSGLLKAEQSGALIPDLAESFSISEDGLEYRFVLKDSVMFHDGEEVTTDDILFTISRAQDPAVKSPKRANWDGVTVEKINEKEIKFTLRQPYAPFLENATLGILPAHIWKNVSPEQMPFSGFNTEPVGSGPYIVRRVKKDSSGFPELYRLKAFKNYALGTPFIREFDMRFYSNEEELLNGYKKGEIESINSVSPALLSELKNVRIERVPLPRIFAVFFNQNKAAVFANKEVRVALDRVIDKDGIVDSVLGGYGSSIESPLPPGVLDESPIDKSDADPETVLRDALWEKSEDGTWEKETKDSTERLQFRLATSNVAELKAVGEILEAQWKDFGADVTLQIFEPGDLNQNVIRPRNYEALLFGEIVGRELDLFAFWHSSQRNDPGLNIALYANITADKLLEEARTENDKEMRLLKLKDFESEVQKDQPAVFLYSPDFIYIVPKKLKGLSLGSVTTPSERFLGVHNWHIETEKVWKFFE